MLKNSTKKTRYGTFYAGIAAAALFAAAVPASIVLADYEAQETPTAENPFIEISMADVNPNETLKKTLIEKEAALDTGFSLDDVNVANSTIELDGFDRTKSGLQNVTARVTLANKENSPSSISYSFVQEMTVKMVNSSIPTLKLKDDKVVVNNGDTFIASNYIAYINDNSGVLPVLQIDGDVNMKKDGKYPVTYTAIDNEGNKAEAKLIVEVKTPEEVIKAREEAERKAREEAERKEAERLEEERLLAEQRAAQEAAEAAAKAAAESGDSSTASSVESAGGTPTYGSGGNPYGGGNSNCTATAWQLAYENAGVALPGWGNAGSWLWSAQNSGYQTSSTPRSRAIAVYSNHVAYVSSVSSDSSTVYIQEGGFDGGYHEAWVSSSGSVWGQQVLGYIYLP